MNAMPFLSLLTERIVLAHARTQVDGFPVAMQWAQGSFAAEVFAHRRYTYTVQAIDLALVYVCAWIVCKK